MVKNIHRKSKFKIIILVIIGIVVFAYLASLIATEINVKMENRIAVIPIEGVIGISSGIGSEEVDPDIIGSYIDKAESDSSVKAIIIDINSPGGTVIASEIIADKIKNAKKPTVALIRDIGASGGYWVASAADEIVAYPMSITGSIGVRGSYLEFSGLLEKYGVKYQSITAGKYKDTGSPYKNLTSQERALLEKTINKIYDYFLEQVSINRDLPESTVRNLANGYIYLGVEAKDNGLIDYVGDEEFAVNLTKNLANITDADLIYYRQKRNVFNLFGGIIHESFYYMGKGIGNEIFNIENKERLNIDLI